MKSEQILPTVLILIDVGAAAVYAFKGQWWHVGYWAAAAFLSFCVTFGMKH